MLPSETGSRLLVQSRLFFAGFHLAKVAGWEGGSRLLWARAVAASMSKICSRRDMGNIIGRLLAFVLVFCNANQALGRRMNVKMEDEGR